jgi:adenylyltransferase/sulfurtransferase
MIQANEVIKYVTGSGDLLTDRLFVWDGMLAKGEEIMIEKDPSCNVCCSKESKDTLRKK